MRRTPNPPQQFELFFEESVTRINIRRGGCRSPTPHGTNPGVVKGGKARGDGGGRTGRRKLSGISPGAKVLLKERLCASLYLSTRDRTSLLLEESSQSLECTPILQGMETQARSPPGGRGGQSPLDVEKKLRKDF